MKFENKKAFRTLQSYFWFIKNLKDEYYIYSQRVFRTPKEPFFHALALIRVHFKGSCVDIGANIGQSIESIRLFMPDAQIYSFEPNPNLARKLSARYRNDPKIAIKGVGLSSSVGQFKLYIPSYYSFVYDGLASLEFEAAKTWINSNTVYFFNPDRLVVNEHACAVETLDMQGIEDPIFVKIDVGGTEYDVVKGGVETLRRYGPVLLIEDFHVKPELQELTRSLGYAPYTFDGSAFVAGASDTSSFLITRNRIDVMQPETGPGPAGVPA